MHVHICTWRRGGPKWIVSVFLNHFLLIHWAGFLAEPTHHWPIPVGPVWLVSFALGLSTPGPQSWDDWWPFHLPIFFFFFNMDAGDPNSHPHTCMTSTLSQWTISGAHILEPKLSFQKHPYRGILYKRLKCQDWYSEILTNDCSE